MKTVQTIADLTAQQQIELLAQEHHLIHNHSQLDEIGATFARLSDNDAIGIEVWDGHNKLAVVEPVHCAGWLPAQVHEYLRQALTVLDNQLERMNLPCI